MKGDAMTQDVTPPPKTMPPIGTTYTGHGYQLRGIPVPTSRKPQTKDPKLANFSETMALC